MTDKEKLDSIRAEIHRLVDVRGYDKGMANDLFAFMDSLPNEPVNKDFEMALAEMVDKAQKCVVEPLVVAAQWKDELIKLAKCEEPVSEKKCMFTKDSYTDEDRKVLCADCDEKCEYSKKEELGSEDLEEAVDEYAPDFSNSIASKAAVNAVRDAFKAGAKWQLKQMMAKAIDATCFGFQGAALFSFRLPASNYLVGSKVKVIVIKQE